MVGRCGETGAGEGLKSCRARVAGWGAGSRLLGGGRVGRQRRWDVRPCGVAGPEDACAGPVGSGAAVGCQALGGRGGERPRLLVRGICDLGGLRKLRVSAQARVATAEGRASPVGQGRAMVCRRERRPGDPRASRRRSWVRWGRRIRRLMRGGVLEGQAGVHDALLCCAQIACFFQRV